MNGKYIQKHINLAHTHIDYLDEIIADIPGINNYSEAIRYVIQNAAEKKEEPNINLSRKMNALSKNLDVLVEMVAGGFDFQGVYKTKELDETFIYQDAVKRVEKNIQRSTTKKSEVKSSAPKRESVLKEPTFRL